jgi:hypothetical protein
MDDRMSSAATPVRLARELYYAASDLPADGGFSSATVTYPIGRWRLTLPNVDARRRALPLHDLHHLATGYPTTWRGEGQIGAWELGSGCFGYGAAWGLAFGAFSAGLLIAPGRMWKAFVRGRRSDSLFRHEWDDRWLDLTVGELRRFLRLDEAPTRATMSDGVRFALWCVPLMATLIALVLLALGR